LWPATSETIPWWARRKFIHFNRMNSHEQLKHLESTSLDEFTRFFTRFLSHNFQFAAVITFYKHRLDTQASCSTAVWTSFYFYSQTHVRVMLTLDYVRFVVIRVLWFRQKNRSAKQIDMNIKRVQIRRICSFALFANLTWTENYKFWTVTNHESRIIWRHHKEYWLL